MLDNFEILRVWLALYPHDIRFQQNTGNLRGHGVHVEIDVLRTRRRGFEVVGTFMRRTDQVDALVGHVEGVVPLAVGGGVRRLLHAPGQPDERDDVTCRRLAGGAVGNGTGDRPGGKCDRRKDGGGEKETGRTQKMHPNQFKLRAETLLLAYETTPHSAQYGRKALLMTRKAAPSDCFCVAKHALSATLEAIS